MQIIHPFTEDILSSLSISSDGWPLTENPFIRRSLTHSGRPCAHGRRRAPPCSRPPLWPHPLRGGRERPWRPAGQLSQCPCPPWRWWGRSWSPHGRAKTGPYPQAPGGYRRRCPPQRSRGYARR